jgi:hypothetical protein
LPYSKAFGSSLPKVLKGCRVKLGQIAKI